MCNCFLTIYDIKYSYLIQIIFKTTYLTNIWDLNRYYHTENRVDPGVMAMKGYSALQKPQNRRITIICSYAYLGHPSPEVEIVLLLCRGYSQHILSPTDKLRFRFMRSFLKLKYEVHTISFQIFFVKAFKIVVDFWKFSMLLLYILWDDWPIFMISSSNE